MKIIEGLIQGSQEWKEFRRKHVGASDASIVMGLNPWRTTIQLWEEKTLGWEQEMNDKMRDGQKMEDEARECYEKISGLKVKPKVAECEINPFLSASFDGITDSYDYAVEIKCGKASHYLAKNNVIPPYYYSQLQHQMMIAGIFEMDYFSYSKKDQFSINVKRDDEFIIKMIEKELEFWNNVINFMPPKVGSYE